MRKRYGRFLHAPEKTLASLDRISTGMTRFTLGRKIELEGKVPRYLWFEKYSMTSWRPIRDEVTCLGVGDVIVLSTNREQEREQGRERHPHPPPPNARMQLKCWQAPPGGIIQCIRILFIIWILRFCYILLTILFNHVNIRCILFFRPFNALYVTLYLALRLYSYSFHVARPRYISSHFWWRIRGEPKSVDLANTPLV